MHSTAHQLYFSFKTEDGGSGGRSGARPAAQLHRRPPLALKAQESGLTVSRSEGLTMQGKEPRLTFPSHLLSLIQAQLVRVSEAATGNVELHLTHLPRDALLIPASSS